MSKDDTGNGWVVSDEQWDTLSDEERKEKTFSLPTSDSVYFSSVLVLDLFAYL
jgi:hypothetical protein